MSTAGDLGKPDTAGTRRTQRTGTASKHFQGEYALQFGPMRIGRSFDFNSPSNAEGSPDYNAYHLRLEATHKNRCKSR